MAWNTIKKRWIPFNTEELYNLCNKRQITCTREEAFERIREWLNRNKDNSTRLKKALTYQGRYSNSPLHTILEIGPPLDIVQNIINYAPETLQMRNEFGQLPIHYACIYGASLEVIQALVKSYPDSIKVTDNHGGFLPLHWACRKKASLGIVTFLFHSYPDGIDQTNEYDATPLDYLQKEYEMTPDNNDMLPLHAMQIDINGMTPLHHACIKGYSLRLIHFLFQTHPESATIQDNDGYIPLQYLNKTASRVDDRGMLLLHREAAHSKGLCVAALPLLLKANPEAIGVQDKSGWLPLHHASLNEASSLDALMLLIKLYPESIAR